MAPPDHALSQCLWYTAPTTTQLPRALLLHNNNSLGRSKRQALAYCCRLASSEETFWTLSQQQLYFDVNEWRNIYLALPLDKFRSCLQNGSRRPRRDFLLEAKKRKITKQKRPKIHVSLQILHSNFEFGSSISDFGDSEISLMLEVIVF